MTGLSESATTGLGRELYMETGHQASATVLLGASSFLRSEDAGDLRWYFRQGGIETLTTSNWGAQLERLSHFAHGCVECEECGGSRAKKIPGDGLERRAAATEHQSELLALIEIEVPRLTGEWCPSCEGRGITPKRPPRPHGPLTARPTGSSKHGRVPRDADHGDLARLGSISRRLDRLRDRYPDAVDVLAVYYGPDHDRTVYPLYRLTSAGKTLMRRNMAKLPWRAFFENELKDARDRSDGRRIKLFDAAKEQAQELYRAACQAWNTVHRPKAKPTTEPGQGAA